MGVRILTDKCRIYDNLERLGWRHHSFNHSIAFVNRKYPSIHKKHYNLLADILKKIFSGSCFEKIVERAKRFGF